MNFKKVNEDLYLIDDVLSLNDLILVHDEFNPWYNKWLFNKREPNKTKKYPCRGQIEKIFQPEGSLGYNFQLIRVGTIVKLHCEYFLKKKLDFKRIHTNIQFFGQESTFHIDSDERSDDKYWSFLIFVDGDWSIEYGGDFICQIKKHEYRNVPFIPNNGVLFNSSLPHRGAAPNSLCLHKPRKTVQFLFNEVDSTPN
tara:strand:- start:236 stop:826 length:591 start_codon:yes stop_codon:yes gene_type:complete